MKIISIIIFILLSAGLLNAATYNYYFSNDPSGNPTGNDTTGNGSIGNPWKTLSKAQSQINALGSSDSANLYFDRGDTWTVATGQVEYILRANSWGPIVNIDVYGTGNKPIFDGSIHNFSTAANDGSGTPPYRRYHSFFNFSRTNCSISNIEIKNVYGNAIGLNEGDNFTLRNCEIQNIGMAALAVNFSTGGENNLVEYNKIYLCQQLSRYDKFGGRYMWGAGIHLFAHSSGVNSMCKNNIVRHNLVYDIYGEGIAAPNSIIEYNLIGDTSSLGIDTAAHDFDTLTAVVRYNLITMSDWSTSVYDNMNGSSPAGIRIYDEAPGGDNSAADISVYGNIMINRWRGVWFFCSEDCNNPFGSVKIYNNLAIDSHRQNFAIWNPEEASAGYVYNNASVRYDRNYAHTNNSAHANWAFSHNAFNPIDGTNTVGTGWTTNYVTDDPMLPGEPIIDWDGQDGPTYIKDIDFMLHLYPQAGSALINAGKTLFAGFDKKFLGNGCDFGDLPNTATFNMLDQTDHGAWDIGPAVYSSGGDITPPEAPTGLVIIE